MLGKLRCPPDDLGGSLRLRARMRRHDLHPKAAGANRNCRVFDQIREYTMVETQGRRDPADRLSSQQYRHQRPRVAQADDSGGGKRFAQNVSDMAHLFSQCVTFSATYDLNGLQHCRALRR